MYIYLDTLNIEEIEKYSTFIDGVTSTPTFIARENISDYGIELFKKILSVLSKEKTLHISVPFRESNNIIRYMKHVLNNVLPSDTDRITFKIPCTEEGIRVAKRYGHKYKIGLHLIYTIGQVMMANDTPAKWHYLLLGRGNEHGYDMQHIVEMSKHPMLASIRNVDMLYPYIATNISVTISPKVLRELITCEDTLQEQTKFIDDFTNGNSDSFDWTYSGYQMDSSAEGNWYID